MLGGLLLSLNKITRILWRSLGTGIVLYDVDGIGHSVFSVQNSKKQL
jgi:hypothetical protein